MGWSKRDLIIQALDELGLASYVFSIEPEQFVSAARKLDMIANSWSAEGVDIGYSGSSSPDSGDLDSDSGIIGLAVEAVVLTLAIRLSPSYGKEIPIALISSAAKAKRSLMVALSPPVPQMSYGEMLHRGAGAKRVTTPDYYQNPADTIDSGSGPEIEFT